MATKQICMRIPEEVADWLEKKAEEEHRSLSGQTALYLIRAKAADSEGK